MILGGCIGFFTQFIACGAKIYKVSLTEDHDYNSVPEYSHDPQSHYFGIHASSGWQKTPIPFKISAELNDQQKEGLVRAMHTWELAVGKTLFEYQGLESHSGDSFSNLYQSLDDDTNGYYLDQNWKKTGKSSLVLATTVWTNDTNNLDIISTADIRFNSENYLIGNSYHIEMTPDETREVVDMESLALHELGHLLGLSHISEEHDRHSIMNPSLYVGEGLATRTLSEEDVLRIQTIYGCENESCDLNYVMEKLNAREAGTVSENEPYFSSQNLLKSRPTQAISSTSETSE